MKTIVRFILSVVLLCGSLTSVAQYYQAANQLTGMLQPILSGSAAYRGFVEASGLAGIGNNKANFVGISTTQGIRFTSWLYSGVGIGLDVAINRSDDFGHSTAEQPWYGRSVSKTKLMLPVFSDFRFYFGEDTSTSFFLDIRMGASWLLGDSDLYLGDATMGHGAQFYFRPAIGIRVPVDANDSRHAFNIGLTYHQRLERLHDQAIQGFQEPEEREPARQHDQSGVGPELVGRGFDDGTGPQA